MSDDDHLSNLSDGAGCTEIWEHLSEQREAAKADDEAEADESTTETDAESDDEETTDEEATASLSCP